ncbi:helix-turn-helix transcriptional regulator [Sediminicola luteus]|uniref:AraC family transcriptional regulator n=1 Tax=Sediminicola luteus TaxID=319238 RepID=A0A2A4GFH6_9FLAO|nr:AraC family transcriptional regulator [Sediminicola luteus]PCE66535.1 AraC family transcriptional regulator [Sediminicola luteus]
MDKNIATGSFDIVYLREDSYVLKIQNDSDEVLHVEREIDSSFIQFHFCLKGSGKFLFNQGNYALEVSEEQSLLLYNTQTDLPLNLQLQPQSWLISVVMSLRKFHTLFSHEASFIPFLADGNKLQKHYAQEPVSPPMAIILSQIFHFNMHPSVKELYIRGKIFELMALYFNKGNDVDVEQCPFLINEDNVQRIRKAKEIMIERMAEPPTLNELATEIGLPLKKLKEGFKQIYGEPVYGFLFDYKMEFARKLLASGQHNVNEVGLKVGYSTASHFIAAFKKKFGTTPKKYLMSLAGGN